MTRAEQLAALRRRWLDVAPDVLNDLGEALLRGKGSIVSPFGLVDQRQDLRGLPKLWVVAGEGRQQVGEKQSRRWSRKATFSTWEALDLSGADLAQMNWFQHSIASCTLDDADLTGLRCWGLLVRDTSLQRAVLRDGQLGAGAQSWPTRSQWIDVDLAQADLRNTSADVRFQGVSFRNAKFSRTDWGWSDLTNCAFNGVVDGLTIGRRPVEQAPRDWTLQGVDFTGARPRNLRLIGVDLGSPRVQIRFPEDDMHRLVTDWPQFLDRVEAGAASASVDSDDRRTAKIWVDHWRRDLGLSQSEGFVALWDVRRLGGEALVSLLSAALNAA